MKFKNSAPYIIGEVGQNHQGELKVALEYVNNFAVPGASALKFQMRNNRRLFTCRVYDRAYHSENAFGKTYGEHRDFLELNSAEMSVIRQACKEKNLEFVCTPFDRESLECLLKIGVDAIKIASFDLGNYWLIKEIAQTGLPVIFSTGAGSLRHIESTLELLEGVAELAMLYCVSNYPCEAEDLNLSRVSTLIKNYGDRCSVGVSDHFNGTLSGPIARLLGAEVFEKHITLNRAWKGTDHGFALTKHGFEQFIRDINRADLMIGYPDFEEVDPNPPVFQKLGKHLVATCDIENGSKFSDINLSYIISDTVDAVPVRESRYIFGSRASRDILAGEIITTDLIREQ